MNKYINIDNLVLGLDIYISVKNHWRYKMVGRDKPIQNPVSIFLYCIIIIPLIVVFYLVFSIMDGFKMKKYKKKPPGV